jgi:hypothetical protein
MKKEKIILSFAALLIGVGVAIASFFIHQSTRKVKSTEIKTITINDPSPTPASGLFLTLDSPRDEEVVSTRSIKVSGKTTPDAKIVILTQDSEEAALPTKDGSFTTDINLSQDENIIEVSAIGPNGEIVKVTRVVLYSTESF